MNTSPTFIAIVAKAPLYIELGQLSHYLSAEDRVPWEYVTTVEPGGSHRLDISTGVWFTAVHPCGLSFKWAFEIEPRSADGSPDCKIDALGCRLVLELLPQSARRMFKDYLASCADAVLASAIKYQMLADKEFNIGNDLKRLAE